MRIDRLNTIVLRMQNEKRYEICVKTARTVIMHLLKKDRRSGEAEKKALRYMVWVRNALFLYAQLCELCGFAWQTLAITSV